MMEFVLYNEADGMPLGGRAMGDGGSGWGTARIEESGQKARAVRRESSGPSGPGCVLG